LFVSLLSSVGILQQENVDTKSAHPGLPDASCRLLAAQPALNMLKAAAAWHQNRRQALDLFAKVNMHPFISTVL
jgi:hypothetical protein